ALRGPGSWNFNLSAAKNFAVGERVNLKVRADLFDALNHANLSGLVSDITKSNFGALTSASSRTIQLGAKGTFLHAKHSSGAAPIPAGGFVRFGGRSVRRCPNPPEVRGESVHARRRLR